MKTQGSLYFLSSLTHEDRTLLNLDWIKTSLGNPENWPPSLKTMTAFMLDNTCPMCILWGKDLSLLHNVAFQPFVGQQAIGSNGQKLLHTAWNEIGPMVEDTWKGKSIRHCDYRLLLRKNQKDYQGYFDLSFVPIRKEDGEVGGVSMTMTETTDEMQAGLMLRESEEKFRTMAESTDILIAIGDETSNATFFNRAWVDLTGRPMEKLLKFGWADLVHPDDKDRYLQLYLTAFEKKVSFTGEFRVLNKDGKYRWLLAKGPPLFRPDGTFYGYISSCMDITDHVNARLRVEENEQTLRSMVLEAPIGICLIDGPTLVSEVVNESFIEVAGKPYEAIAGKFYWDTFKEARPYYEQALNDVVTKGITYYANEVELMLIRHGKEEMIFVTFVYAPLKDNSGRVRKVAVWVLENTPQVVARKKIEDIVTERTKELERINNELLKSNDELAQFAYIASHDLQEPLRKIATFTRLLQKELGDNISNQAALYYDKIISSSSRMSQLVKDVLAYSQLSKPDSFSKVDLNTVIANAKIDFELLIDQRSATIRTSALPVIDAIAPQMAQLFGNLIGNSLKFTGHKEAPLIDITCHEVTAQEVRANALLFPDHHYVRIMVRDNGIGFETEQAEKIFNIFQRLHGQSEFEGTGIGLAMCKKIAQNHHGDINATGSSPGSAVFNVILPTILN